MQPGLEDELLYGIGLMLCGIAIVASGVKHSHCKGKGIDWIITFTALPFFFLSWFVGAQAFGVDNLGNTVLIFYSRFAIVMIGVLTVLHHLNGRVNAAIDGIIERITTWIAQRKSQSH